MTLTELLSEDPKIYFEDVDENDEVVEEAKVVKGTDYKRHWVEWPLDEKHYSKKTGNRLYGYWSYEHREAAGAHYGDKKIIHHKNHDKHDNSKSNLQVVDRSTHCQVDPNARKCFKCKICGAEHYSHGLCKKHYMRKFRAGKFGNYDPNKNYSKEDR